MCGVNGIITYSLSEDEILKRLEVMGDLQDHRGPDDKRELVFSFKNGHVGFGFRRLSILDLETGMQPIVCGQDNSAIICNGQIYNYIELKFQLESCGVKFNTSSDTEVVLQCWIKWQEKALSLQLLNTWTQ